MTVLQELEAVLVLTQPSVFTKRLLLRYQPEQQLQQLKQQLLDAALPAIMQVRLISYCFLVRFVQAQQQWLNEAQQRRRNVLIRVQCCMAHGMASQ
jgi:hypothetical protein